MANDNTSIPAIANEYVVSVPEKWRPKIKAGYFWAGDIPHYLFADKNTLSLQQMQVLKFTLPTLPDMTQTSTLRVDGIPYTNYWFSGNNLFLHLADPVDQLHFWQGFADADQVEAFLSGFQWLPETVIELDYIGIKFTTTGSGVHPERVTIDNFRVALNDYLEHMFLFPTDKPPVKGKPVVLTDDSVLKTDKRSFAVEYYVDFVDNRLYLNSDINYLNNPIFSAVNYATDIPDYWNTDGGVAGIGQPDDGGYTGDNIIDPTGVVYQTFDYNKQDAITISARFRRTPTATGIKRATLEVVYIDVDGAYLDSAGSTIGNDFDADRYTEQAFAEADRVDWRSLYIDLGAEGIIPGDPTGVPIPSTLDKIQVRLRSDDNVQWDAVKASEGRRRQFDHVDLTGTTVEYEIAVKDHYVPDPYSSTFSAFPDLNDIDLNGTISETFAGFLCIEHFSDTSDYLLGQGGPVADGDDEPVTYPRGIIPATIDLTDIDGLGAATVSREVAFGRRYLPYAQIDSRSKLAYTPAFHTGNLDRVDSHFVSEEPLPREPHNVVVDSYQSSSFRDSITEESKLTVKLSDSIQLFIAVVDELDNPIIHEKITGAASTGTIASVFDNTVQSVYTNYAGRAYMAYTAPSTGTSDEVSFTHAVSGKVFKLVIDLVS